MSDKPRAPNYDDINRLAIIVHGMLERLDAMADCVEELRQRVTALERWQESEEYRAMGDDL